MELDKKKRGNKMNKKNIVVLVMFIIVIVSILLFAFFRTSETPKTDYYARGVVITDINTQKDLVTVEDCSGLVWQFYGVEDFCVGDGCVMVLDKKGTQNIYDDEIINVHYERFDILNEKTENYEKN